jgi:hypothetical protein
LRFFIIDPSLYDLGGHNLDYALEVGSAVKAQGVNAVLVANCRFLASGIPLAATPVFSQGLREPAALSTRIKSSIMSRISRLGHVAGLAFPRFEPLADRAHTMIRDLSRWVSATPSKPEDIWFFPTISWRDAIAILSFYRGLSTKPSLHMVLRFDPPDNQGGQSQLKNAVRGLPAKVGLWADTPELAKIYGEITGQVLHLIRMPFPSPADPSPRERPYLLYLGEARVDKGFQFLPRIAAGMQEHLPNADLIVQILNDPNGDPQIAAAAASLASLTSTQIKLLHGSLDSVCFTRLIADAGAVLCLHEPRTYRYRSAGIVTQAIAAGVPVIMRPGISAPYEMIKRNGCNDLLYLVEDGGNNDWKGVNQALDVTIRRRRTLDCIDLWNAPWLNLKH